MFANKRIVGLLFAFLFACTMLQANDSVSCHKRWLDDHPKHIGFSWNVNATLTSNYLWRGLYCGGPSVQLDATVGYGGFYANMWWNVGATEWSFTGFNPEVDVMIGFSRWGLNINYLHCFYFDQYSDGSPTRFFDFSNHPRGGGGTTGEWRISYRVSDRLPLSVLVACRTFSRDGYYASAVEKAGYPMGVAPGDDVYVYLKRAYSTYIELGYDFDLTQDWWLAARVGVTPWKSLYTRYQGDFAVTMVQLKLTKTWNIRLGGERLEAKGDGKCGKVTAFANVMLQPWQVTKDNLIKAITEAGDQKLNFAIGCSVSL
jgi:hypothetical protein